MADGGAVLGIDVGGTGIKARLVGVDGHVLDEWRVPTPTADPDASALAAVVVGLVGTARSACTARTATHGATTAPMTLDAVGLVVPGIVDDALGIVRHSVNLGWRDVPVRARITTALRDADLEVPVAFGQDVRAGALAEVRTGAHGGSVAFVAVGTGLASALAVDGDIVVAGGLAGEIGQVVLPEGPFAGMRVEEIASAGAVARRAGAPGARAVADRVSAGDPTALRVWDDCVRVLADAIAWIVAVGGCSTVIVGGGLAESGSQLLTPLGTALRERLGILAAPSLVPAHHGDAAGAIGATLLARDLLVRTATAADRVVSA